MAGSGRTWGRHGGRVAAKNRNSAQGNKPRTPAAGRPQPMMMTRGFAPQVEELELENALMREVVES